MAAVAAGVNQGMEEGQGQERECREADRDAWKKYRDGGRTDHASALRLVNSKHTPKQHKGFHKAHRDRHERHNETQRMRYEAEWDFFNIRDQPVRDLMRRVTEHQYRDEGADVPPPIDLTGKSARHVIAAARLQQETWLTLVRNITDVHRSIPVAHTKSFKMQTIGKKEEKFIHFGPRETYEAKFEGRAYEVESEHRTEGVDEKEVPADSIPQLGMSFVIGLNYYNNDILPDLKGIMCALGGAHPGPGQRRLADLFAQFAKSHSLAGAPELSDEQRDKLFKICFLIMEKEQAQWQSSFFSRFVWQLGMSVSFARLIILFREGKITLHDVFNRYGIYGNHPKIKGKRNTMLESNDCVRARCDAIDQKYAWHMRRPLTKEDAEADLREVYGDEEGV
ncbi:uncharacterized protein LOC113213709 [Frankliniella occidentalis]|uniref:Uncharacterized protein LOC113213709 n=1 Tax=Frankliniella occidentalis TaxID=133901 RepID=A0A6J1TAC8_FRAOC|nr:uncharacterized protein LOC113213709 [Frankliniella occidentalis]